MNCSSPNSRDVWITLWNRLHMLRAEPLPSPDEADRLLQALPPRNPDETFRDWLRRAETSSSGSNVVAFPSRFKSGVAVPFARPRFSALTAIERLAASSQAEAYPLPEGPMLTPDGAFRLRVAKIGDELELRVEGLGADAFEYAGCCIGISVSESVEDVIAFVYLDDIGDGVTRVADSAEVRAALARPVLGLLEPSNEHE
jgi:hypothetical protein